MKFQLIQADARELPLADKSVQCVVTSPPYFGLRDYGVEGQLGLEPTPEEFVANMVQVFREVRRVLRDDGTLWLNIGDSYAGSWGAQSRGNTTGEGTSTIQGASMLSARQIKSHPKRDGGTGSMKRTPGLKPKDLIGIPWRVAFALQADGWYLRSDIVWAKPNPMPESVEDRPTRSHEYIFLLTKSERYFYDHVAVREACESGPSDLKKMREGLKRFGGKSIGNECRLNAASARTKVGNNRAVGDGTGRNKRSVWWVAPHGFKGAHFATYPQKLIEPCILAGTSEKGCCPTCRAPWKRQTSKRRRATRPGTESKVTKLTQSYANRDDIDPAINWRNSTLSGQVGNRDPHRHVTETLTTGWAPSCKCDPLPPVPCVVFDPFNGAGTSGLVAVTNGRAYIGTDINHEYLLMARKRIHEAFPLAEFIEGAA